MKIENITSTFKTIILDQYLNHNIIMLNFRIEIILGLGPNQLLFTLK